MNFLSRRWLVVKLRARRFRQSHFVRNVAAVATGVAAAQAISLMFMPILTRIFGPEAFGALAAFSALLNILTPMATLGFANAIVMAKNEEEATAVARLSLVCAVVVAPLGGIGVLLFQSTLAVWTGLEKTPELLYLIPVALMLTALLSVADQTAIREGLFGAKAKSKVVSTFVMNVSKLVGGLAAPVAWLLIVLETLARAINYFMLLALVPRQGAFRISRWFGVQGTVRAAKRHRDFAIFRMPQSVTNAAAVGLPVILLTSFFGAEHAGQYSLTTLLLGVPITLLGQSVGEVFYPKITSAIQNRSPDAWRQMTSATLVLGGLAVVPFSSVVVFGPELFALVLGEEWYRAGEYAQWVAPWLGLTLATRPIVASFPVLRLQAYLLFQEFFSVAARTAAFFLGLHYWKSDLAAVALFSAVGVFLMCMHLAVGTWTLRRRIRRWAIETSQFVTKDEVYNL